VIVGSTNSVGAPSPQDLAGLSYVFSTWSDGGSSSHMIVAGANPATYTAAYQASSSSQKLIGHDVVAGQADYSAGGTAEAFQYTASANGTVDKFYLYVDANNAASRIVIGLYSNTTANRPGTLLSQATIANPVNGTWNTAVAPAATITNGTKYWIAVLGPYDAGWVWYRDTAGGGISQASAQNNLNVLPATWTSGPTYSGSPASAYAVQTP
jgi:hypothetical protein